MDYSVVTVQCANANHSVLSAQSFGLLGTLVGLFIIAIGIGPRTVPDLVYHAAILAVLVWGLIVAARAGAHAVG